MSELNSQNELTSLLKKGIARAKADDYSGAKMYFKEALRQDPENQTAWLWMSQVVETDREKLLMLKQVLRINPDHVPAKKGIEFLEKKEIRSIPVATQPAETALQAESEDGRPQQAEGDQIQDGNHQPAGAVVVQPARHTRTTAFREFPSEDPDRSMDAAVPVKGIKDVQSGNFLERWQIQLGTNWKRFATQLRLSGRRFKMFWDTFSRNRLAVLGVVMLIFYALMAIAHPILLKTVWPSGIYDPITGYDFKVINPADPSASHIFGTDNLGRDVLSMLLSATTPAFILGITAALLTAITGILSGVSAAYFGGATDYILTRIADAFLMLPAPIFMIIVGVAFHDFGPVKLGIIFGVINGLGGAMITLKSYAKTVLARPFIQATKLSGGGSWYTIRRHLVPHMIPMAATLMMMAVISAVVADSFVSFTGIIRDHLNWGTMIYNSLEYIKIFGGVEWHVLIPPSIALSMFAASFYLISRGMHEVADPKLRAK